MAISNWANEQDNEAVGEGGEGRLSFGTCGCLAQSKTREASSGAMYNLSDDKMCMAACHLIDHITNL